LIGWKGIIVGDHQIDWLHTIFEIELITSQI
jgi:hypothetical protein